MRRIAEFDARLDNPIDGRALEVLRIAVGPLVLMHLQPFLADAWNGISLQDRFWQPFWDWYPVASDPIRAAILGLTAIAAILVSVGLATRASSWIVATGVGYNLFLSQTHFHHNRTFLLILLVAVAMLPLGQSLAVDSVMVRSRPKQAGRFLVLAVVRFEVAVVYIASGFSKLIDADWIGGTVTQLRVESYAGSLIAKGLPEGVVDLLSASALHDLAAPMIVGTELFIGLGLLWPRTRLAAIWVAIPFHVLIEFAAEVQVFSWAALTALVIWVTPSSGDRIIEARPEVLTRVKALDWLGRFQFVVGSGPLQMTDRDGVDHTGRRAALIVASRLPATFWFALPLLAFHRVKRRRSSLEI